MPFGKDRVIGGVPGYGELVCDHGDRSVIDNECFQSPTESGPGDLRSGRGRLAGVMAPHASAEFAFIASESDEQNGGAVPEGVVRQFPSHGVAGNAVSAASAAPLIVGRRGAQEHYF